MKRVLIKSNKLNNKTASGGQFYSAFNTIEALFFEYEKNNNLNNLQIGFYYPFVDERNLNTYLSCSYKRSGDYIYPSNSVSNDGKWDYIHLLTEDLIIKDLLFKKTLFHIRGIQDWVLHEELKEKTKYKRHLIVKFLGRFAFNQIVPSTNIKNELIKYYNFKPNSVNVIPNGFDLKLFSPTTNEDLLNSIKNKYSISGNKPFILHVSDLSYKKNIDVLLDAFKLISDKVEVQLLIIGGRSKEYKNEFKLKAEILNLTDKITFMGKVEQKELPVFYYLANHFIFPSRSESFGKPALEAMACGCPAIVSERTAACDFMSDSELLVKPKDVTKIVELSLKLLKDNSYRKSQSELAIKYSQHYSWNDVAKKLFNYYLSLP